MGVLALGRVGRRHGLVLALTMLGGAGLLQAGPAEAGYASMLVDVGTGEVLNEVNADDLNHPASLTKMMTLYLAFEAMQHGKLTWDTALPVSSFAAAKSPTKLGLRQGETITVREAVLGMIVLSANDAACAVGEYLGDGSETAFARIMTAKAHALGMTSTTFRNASGLPDDEQVTTARDLVKLSLALYRDFPQHYHYFKTREFTYRGRIIGGHNHILDQVEGADGLKTGFTSASGFNLAASAARDGQRLVGVVMGGQSAPARDRLMATLLENGFAGQSTDPILVAQAAGQDTRPGRPLLARARTVVAALNPIGRAEAAPLKPAVVTAVSSPRWTIQVGAFGRATQAEQAASQAIKLAALHQVHPLILPPSHLERVYRAQLTGFANEKSARDACHVLSHKGEVCVVVPPAKSGLRLAGN